MILDFIGTGSAFNTERGNNGAFRKQGDELFLIDCGSSTYGRLREANLLEGVKHVNVIITHTHADHIGSLADLIFHMKFKVEPMFSPKVHIHVGNWDAVKVVELLLKIQGVEDKNDYWISAIHPGRPMAGVVVDYVHRQQHVPNLTSIGLDLIIDGKHIYYSGDTNLPPRSAVNLMKKGNIDEIYQDTCAADYEGNVHLSLRELNNCVPLEIRHNVYCMHVDEGFDVEEASELGFPTVTSVLD